MLLKNVNKWEKKSIYTSPIKSLSNQKFYLTHPNNGAVYNDSLSQKYNIAVYPCWYLKQDDGAIGNDTTQNYTLTKICCFELIRC